MAEISINKLIRSTNSSEGDDNKAFFYLETKWLENQISVKVQDSQSGKCYQGTMTAQTLKDSASELDEPFNDYYEECRAALTTLMALPGYTYKLDEDECRFKVWKSSASSIPMLYLEIPMTTIRNHYDIFDTAIDQLQTNSKSLSERIEKAHKFDEYSRELLEDYRLCVEEKNQLEKKLLRKVSVLLNAKKQKISDLEERLRKYENETTALDSGEDINMVNSDDERPQTSRKRRPLLVESDSDDDDDEAFSANTEALTLPGEIK